MSKRIIYVSVHIALTYIFVHIIIKIVILLTNKCAALCGKTAIFRIT